MHAALCNAHEVFCETIEEVGVDQEHACIPLAFPTITIFSSKSVVYHASGGTDHKEIP